MPSNTTDQPKRRTYTIATWCRSIGISVRTYYKLEERHEAPATFRVGRKVLITEEAAETWLKARGQMQPVAVELPEWAKDPRKLREALQEHERGEAIRATLRDPEKLRALQTALAAAAEEDHATGVVARLEAPAQEPQS